MRAASSIALALAALVAVAVPPAAGHSPASAAGGEPILYRPSHADTVTARERFFGKRNVDPKSGRIRRGKVILSWFGVTNFAMAIDGKVVLLDAWIPRGAHSGYVPATTDELVALRPKFIFIGHSHFDHAADATPLALASGARLVGTAEHCAELQGRAPVTPPRCVAAIPAGAPAGTLARPKLLRRVRVRAFKHIHSAVRGPDGFHVPVTPVPSTTPLEHPPTPRDLVELLGHLPDAEGGTVLYRFKLGRFTLAWNDSAGPLTQDSPETIDRLRRLGPVDVQVGSIQGFNQVTNGMRDARTYIEALRPRLFVPAHHDDWAYGITTRGELYEPYLRDELAMIPAARRPRVRFIADPADYVRPGRLTFRIEKPRRR